MKWIIILGVLIVGMIPVGQSPKEIGHWEIQFTLFLIWLSVIVAWLLVKKFHWTVALSYLIAMVSAITHYLYPTYYFSQFTEVSKASFGSVVAGSGLFLTLIAVVGLLLPKKHNNHLGIALVTLAVLDACAMIINPHHWWVLTNPAMDASFLCICLPLLFHVFKFPEKLCPAAIISIVLVLTAVIISESSTALMALGCAFACFWLFRYGWMTTIYSLIVGFALAGWGFHHLGVQFLNSNGRYHIWQLSMDIFHYGMDKVLGEGTGSFWLYGPLFQFNERTQAHVSTAGDTFTMLHNDWLQVLFENGYLGLVAVSLVFIFLVWNVRNRPALASSIITYGVVAFLQFPLRTPITAILGAFLIHACYVTEESGSFYPDSSGLLGQRRVTVKKFLGQSIPIWGLGESERTE